MSNLDKFLYGVCCPIVVVGMGYAISELHGQFEDMEVDMIVREHEINESINAERLAIDASLILFWDRVEAMGDGIEQFEPVVNLQDEIKGIIYEAIRSEMLGGEEYAEYGNCTYSQYVSLTADWSAFTTDLPDFLQVSRTVFGSNKVDEDFIRAKIGMVRVVCDNSFDDLNTVAYLILDDPSQIIVKLSYHDLDNCDRQDTLAHEFGHMLFDVNGKEHDLGVDKIYHLGYRFGDKCRQSPK